MGIDRADLDAWVDEGIISREQADRIERFSAGSRRGPGIGREIIGYLGAALVLAATLLFVVDSWDRLSDPARILLSAGATVVLTAAGIVLRRSANAATRRLGRVALMLGAAPAGWTVGLLVDSAATEEMAVLSGFAAALAYSAVFYVTDRSWAQHLALACSAAGTAIAAGAQIEGDEGVWVAGLLLVVVGGMWLGGSVVGRLPPRVIGELASIAALGVGSLMVAGPLASGTAPAVAAMAGFIAASIGLVALGVAIDRVVVIVGGVLGLLVYLPWLVNDLLGGGAGAPLALLIGGVVLIGAAVLLTRRASRGEVTSPRP